MPFRVNDECNCLALKKAARKAIRLYDNLLAPAGIRSTQFSILSALNKRVEVTIGEPANELVMDNSTLGQNLRPLEREGLVAISVGEDRRFRVASLTSAGVAKVEEAKVLWMRAQSAFEKEFGDTSSQGMREDLRRLCDGAGQDDLEKR
jgi:DNA-binding MarR family transcriptional regulator